MKFPFTRNRFLLLSLLWICNSIHPWEEDRVLNNECNACDLGCVSLQLQAGIAPIIWTNRHEIDLISCNASSGCPTSTIGPVVPLFETPKFSNLYKLPWTVGGLIGYSLCDDVEIYFEANYIQAKAKHNFTVQQNIALDLFTLQPQFVFNSLSKYRLYDFFVGARYYFEPCWCSALDFFVGGQVGLLHHKGVDGSLMISSLSNPCAAPFTTELFNIFRKKTSFAGGANIGFEYDWCSCLSIIFTAEFIATCGPCGSKNLLTFSGCTADQVLPELRPSAFIIDGAGTEILFPIMLGLKYRF